MTMRSAFRSPRRNRPALRSVRSAASLVATPALGIARRARRADRTIASSAPGRGAPPSSTPTTATRRALVRRGMAAETARAAVRRRPRPANHRRLGAAPADARPGRHRAAGAHTAAAASRRSAGSPSDFAARAHDHQRRCGGACDSRWLQGVARPACRHRARDGVRRLRWLRSTSIDLRPRGRTRQTWPCSRSAARVAAPVGQGPAERCEAAAPRAKSTCGAWRWAASPGLTCTWRNSRCASRGPRHTSGAVSKTASSASPRPDGAHSMVLINGVRSDRSAGAASSAGWSVRALTGIERSVARGVRAGRQLHLRRRCSRQTLPLAFSRSTNFWILPVEVFGSGPNTTVRGTL